MVAINSTSRIIRFAINTNESSQSSTLAFDNDNNFEFYDDTNGEQAPSPDELGK